MLVAQFSSQYVKTFFTHSSNTIFLHELSSLSNSKMDPPKLIKRIIPPFYDKDMLGNSPLHRAVINPNCTVDSIRIYLHTYFLNDRNFLWHTPLHCIIMNNCEKMDVIKLMISKGANVNAKDRNGSTPLHKAVQNHKCTTELIDLLYKNHAHLCLRQFGTDNPLMVAVRNCKPNLDIIKKLFHKACIDICMMHSENSSAIRILCSDVALIKAFLQFSTYVGPRGDSEDEYAEPEAIIDFSCPKKICGFSSIKGRNFKNTDLATALLMFAVMYPCYNMDVIKILLEKGACIYSKNCQNYCALAYALCNRSCSSKLIRELLEYNTPEVKWKVDWKKRVSFLHVAASNRSCPLEVMKLVLKLNIHNNRIRESIYDLTPLDCAADFTRNTYCNLQVVEYLLMKGATPCAQSRTHVDTSVLSRNIQVLGSPDANRDVLDCTKLLVKYALVEKKCCTPMYAYSSINIMCGRYRRRDHLGYLSELNSYLNECFTEVMNMKRTNFGPHNFLKSMIQLGSGPLFGDDHVSTSKVVFILLTSNQFPLYRRLIIFLLSRQVFVDNVSDVLLYTANEKGDVIYLNIYCMKHLVPYLENEDLFNLYLALTDPNNIKPCISVLEQSPDKSEMVISSESDLDDDICACMTPPKKPCCFH